MKWFFVYADNTTRTTIHNITLELEWGFKMDPHRVWEIEQKIGAARGANPSNITLMDWRCWREAKC